MENKTNALDLVKAISCCLIVGSHCLPIFDHSEANFYYGQWFFRFCVPLFFLSTGYFWAKMETKKRIKYIKRIIILYIVASIAYLPAYLFSSTIKQIISNILFGYHHLWYLSALSISLIVIYFADTYLKNKKYLLIVPLVGGVLLGTYYKLFSIQILEKLAKIVALFGGARHAVLFAIPMLLIGCAIAEYHYDTKTSNRRGLYICLYLLLLTTSFIEAMFLKSGLGDTVRLDVTIFGWMPAIPLLLYGLNTNISLQKVHSRTLRKTTDIVYVIHIWVLIGVNKFTNAKLINRFILVIALSFVIAIIIEIVRGKIENLRIKVDTEG